MEIWCANKRRTYARHKNYLQVNYGDKDSLCDLTLDVTSDFKSNAKKIIECLIKEKFIPEQAQEVYSKEEEEEIRRRLEDLGYV